MFNTPNSGNYKPPKNSLAVNTPSSSKKPKQGNYGTIQNHIDRIRDSSPATAHNAPRNVYNYQNILQKVTSTAKKQQGSNDSKQLYSNQDNRSASNSRAPYAIAQNTAKNYERGDYGSQLKANIQEKIAQKDIKGNNYLQETMKNEQQQQSSKPARPSSANHTSYKGYQIENRNDILPLGDNYVMRANKYRNEMEKVISLIGKERKSRDSSPSSMLRKNSKGATAELRLKESLDHKRSVNKRVTLDFEEDLNSKTIENIMMPMTTTYSFSLNKLNNTLKGTKTGRNTPLEKSRQNSIVQKKANGRENFDIDYRNLVLSKDETGNFSMVTAKESPIQLPGKLITASNSRIAHSEVTTQRYNLHDNYHMINQPITLNDCTVVGQEMHQGNTRPSSQLNSRNLNIQTTKENKTIDIASFLKNLTNKRTKEKTDISADSISSQIPNENVQIQELPVTSIVDKQGQTRKASEGIRELLLSSRRDVHDGPSAGSFTTSMKNYFKVQRTRSENPHKGGDRHKNMKIDISQDNLELEQTIKKLLNTSDNLSKRAYKRVLGSKPENNDDRLEVTKGYNFNKDEYEKELHDQFKAGLYAQTPNNIKRATPNDTKLDIPQKQSSPKNVSILSVSSEEREAKKAIFKQDYSIGKEVGRGAYAAVRSGVHKPSNMKVAIKIYQKEKISDPMRRKSVRREIKVMQRMNHPNIIKIYDTFETRNYVNIIMEYVDGPSLYTFLKSQPERRLKEKHAFKLFKQLVDGLDYCHTRCITHRDIKLENILLDRSGNLKMIDFGFTTCIPNDKKVKLFCGTPSYMAPEIVQKKEYCGPPVDIWALGVLLYVLLCGSFPFKGDTDKELYKAISKGEFNIPDYISEEAKKLVRKILNVDADQRPTAKEISNDPWFVIHSFLEKKKANKHRRCASAEKTKGKPSQIITNMVPEFLEIKNNNEGFINLNQFTTGVRAPAFCLTRDRDERTREKSEEIIRRKRCHTPSTNNKKTKHFVFEESNGNKLNFRKFDRGLGTRETENGELFGLEDTYDENKILKRTLNEIEVWNNNTNMSDKSGKRDFGGKSSLLNKTIAILNKSERRDDAMFRYDPEAIKSIINMGYTEEEIIRRLKDKCGIVFAIYTWMTKDNKLLQSSSSSDSDSSDSSGLAKTCYGMLSSNNTTKRKHLNQNARHSPSDEMSMDTKNLYDLNSSNIHKLNTNLKKDVEDLSNKWMEKFG